MADFRRVSTAAAVSAGQTVNLARIADAVSQGGLPNFSTDEPIEGGSLSTRTHQWVFVPNSGMPITPAHMRSTLQAMGAAHNLQLSVVDA